MCTISARLCYEILFLLSVIEKVIDQCETKMTDTDPSIVGQHVQPLKNNYFKAWAGSSYYLLYMQIGYYLSYMQQDFWICHWQEKHKVQFQCSFSRASRSRNLVIYFFVHLITCFSLMCISLITKPETSPGIQTVFIEKETDRSLIYPEPMTR